MSYINRTIKIAGHSFCWIDLFGQNYRKFKNLIQNSSFRKFRKLKKLDFHYVQK